MKRDLLKHIFFHFLRSRHMARHFRYLGMFDSHTNIQNHDFPAELAQQLREASSKDSASLIKSLESRPEGLTDEEATIIRARTGANEIHHEKKLPLWLHAWHCYKNPFNLLLTALCVVAYLSQDKKSAVVILLMVLLSTILRLVQEFKANTSADALKAMVSNTASIIRRHNDRTLTGDKNSDGHWPGNFGDATELPIQQVVPGDIILLSVGDMVPADCRVLSAKNLFISQAVMTGESLPVAKYEHNADSSIKNPTDLENILFMGTNVVSGSGAAIALATGGKTYFGQLAQRLENIAEPTLFQTGVNDISWLLIRIMCVLIPLVILINGITKGNWVEAILFSLSVAVGLTPEMLPLIITSTLAKGAVFLARKKVIVKKLDAIQSLGAMDILCTDKTGTLTQDKVCLARHLDAAGNDSDDVLKIAYINSFYQTGLKNLLDMAVLEHFDAQQRLDIASAFKIVDEIPFDFNRRRMSVVVADWDGKHLLICKGAVEEILSICSQVQYGSNIENLTPELLLKIKQVAENLNQQGLRTVAVALSHGEATQKTYSPRDESGLRLVGYIAFLDPPKESAAPTIKALSAQGISIKILTGDSPLVAAKICRDVGLAQTYVLSGTDIETMGDAELSVALEKDNIFSKLNPIQKERIVRLLRARGHIVGFLGDGINDAAALRAADVGISIDTAVDVAKEAADIILLEKNLLVLQQGVEEGRRTIANMLKYIKITASSNFGNVISVLIASATIPFLPMLPMHLLVQNLLYDICQTTIPFDDVDNEQLNLPIRWRPKEIAHFILFFGPISSVFDMISFATLWFVYRANSLEKQTLFQSGWFVVGLTTQAMVIHMIRTRRIPFYESTAAPGLTIMTVAISLFGIFLTMGPLAPYFKFQSLPLSFFAVVLFIILGYVMAVQAAKAVYTRHYQWD